MADIDLDIVIAEDGSFAIASNPKSEFAKKLAEMVVEDAIEIAEEEKVDALIVERENPDPPEV